MINIINKCYKNFKKLCKKQQINITKNSKKLITGIGTNNIIKIKYINNDIKDAEGNVFIPTQEIHDNVEIIVE